MLNLDFTLPQGKSAIKTFSILNEDDSIYDLTGSTARLEMYLPGTSTALFSINGVVTVLTGIISITFTPTHTNDIKNYEYKLIEIKSDTSEYQLVVGNLIIESYVDQTLSIKAFLRSEFPANAGLSEDFINQKVIYWKYFLYSAANLPEPYIDSDDNWSISYRMLIAKLIAYDVLILALRGSIVAFAGSSTTEMGGSIKSIETGPTKVEYNDSSSALERLLKPGLSGATAMDGLLSDVCGLANKLRIKVPPCKGITINPKVPIYHHYDNGTYISLTETIVITSPSRG